MDYTERMRELREENNYSQKEISELLGIAQTTYSGYETGNRSIPIDIFIRLCDFYDVSADYLIGLSDVRKPMIYM